jgi:hypothetical protein
MTSALWTAGLALLQFLFALVISLYVKDKARIVAEEVVRKNNGLIKDELKNMLSEFSDKLFDKLDKTYSRSNEMDLRFENVHDRIDANDARIAANAASIKDATNLIRKQHLQTGE